MPLTAAADRLTYVGHATVALELDGVRLLTDPLLRRHMLHLWRHAPPPDPAVLRGVHAVLVSHLHFDHLDLPSLRRLGSDVPLLVPRGAGEFLTSAGFGAVAELGVGESRDVGAVTVTAVPAEHDDHRRPHGPVADPVGFVITGTRRIYFAGDTAVFDGMVDLGAQGLDVALLPIWGWGPSLGPGHMDPGEAARAAALLSPSVVVPIHWGTFFPAGLAWVGRHRPALTQPPVVFERECAQHAPDVAVHVLQPGESLPLEVLAPPGGVSRRPRR